MNNNEPIILGKVKKGSGGKPIVVIIIFLFIGSIILFLPTIIKYFGDNNVMDLVKNGQIIDFFTNHNKYVNNNEINKNNEQKEKQTYINSKTVLTNNNITLNNFKLTNEKISFNITTSIDLENEYYYLILTRDNKTINFIRLINGYLEYTFKTKLESIVEIKGEIKKYIDNDYPKYILTSDESGLASLICKKNNDSYEYIFDNNKLIKIKETYKYIDNGNTNEYINNFEKYAKLTNEINENNGVSTITETDISFSFTTDIDLNTYTNIINNNYYSYNTNVNKIYFDMNAKGFDCK